MLRLHVPTMACGGCAKGVTKALANADPKARITIDLTTRHVQIDSVATEQELLAAMTQAGYPAERSAAAG